MIFSSKKTFNIDELDFEKLNGMVPVAVVDYRNNNLLMISFMNKEALQKTISKKIATFYSRTQDRLWTKGSVSGEFLNVVEIKHDCDKDALLLYVIPKGNACHKGSYSCFGNEIVTSPEYLNDLFRIVKSRKQELPEGSYTTRLFKDGKDKIIKKFGEKSLSTVISSKGGKKEDVINDAADLLYHMMVMLVQEKIELSEVIDNLKGKHKKPDENQIKED